QINGGARYAVRIDVDPRKLASRGIGINEVADAVSSANANLPTGTLFGPDKTITVLASGKLVRAVAYDNVIISYRDGRPVRMHEIAHVYDGAENDKNLYFYHVNGKTTRAIGLQVLKQPNTNAVEVADAIKAMLPTLQAMLPPSVRLEIRS